MLVYIYQFKHPYTASVAPVADAALAGGAVPAPIAAPAVAAARVVAAALADTVVAAPDAALAAAAAPAAGAVPAPSAALADSVVPAPGAAPAAGVVTAPVISLVAVAALAAGAVLAPSAALAAGAVPTPNDMQTYLQTNAANAAASAVRTTEVHAALARASGLDSSVAPNLGPPPLRRSERTNRGDPPLRLTETMMAALEQSAVDDPQPYNQIIQIKDANEWKEACAATVASLIENRVYEIMDRQTDKKKVTSKWVFGNKRGTSAAVKKCKARMVVRKFPSMRVWTTPRPPLFQSNPKENASCSDVVAHNLRVVQQMVKNLRLHVRWSSHQLAVKTRRQSQP